MGQTLCRLISTMKRKVREQKREGPQNPQEPQEEQGPAIVSGEIPQEFQRKKRCTENGNGNGNGNEKEKEDNDDDEQRNQQHRKIVNFKENLELLRYFDRFDSPSEIDKETHTRTQTEIREMEMEKGSGRSAAKKRGASSSSSSASSGEALYPGELDLEEEITEEWLQKRLDVPSEVSTYVLTALHNSLIRRLRVLFKQLDAGKLERNLILELSGLKNSERLSENICLSVSTLKEKHDAALAAKSEAKRPAPAIPKTPLEDVDVTFQLPKLPEEHDEIAFVKRPDFDKKVEEITDTILDPGGNIHYMKLLGAMGYGKTRTGKELCLSTKELIKSRTSEEWVYVHLKLTRLGGEFLDPNSSKQTVANFLFYTFCSNNDRLRKLRKTEFSIDDILGKIKKDCGITGIFLHVDEAQVNPEFPKDVATLSAPPDSGSTRVFPLFSGLAADYTFPRESGNSTVIRMELEPLAGNIKEEFEVNVMSTLVGKCERLENQAREGGGAISNNTVGARVRYQNHDRRNSSLFPSPLLKAKEILENRSSGIRARQQRQQGGQSTVAQEEGEETVPEYLENTLDVEFASFGGVPRLYFLFIGSTDLVEISDDYKFVLPRDIVAKGNRQIQEKWKEYYPKDELEALMLKNKVEEGNISNLFEQGLLKLLVAALTGEGVIPGEAVSTSCKTYNELERAGLCSLVSLGKYVSEKRVQIPFIVCACINGYLPANTHIFSADDHASELFKYDWSQFEEIALDTLRNRLLWFSLQGKTTVSLEQLRPGALFASKIGDYTVKVPAVASLIGKRRVESDFDTSNTFKSLVAETIRDEQEVVVRAKDRQRAIDGFIVLDLEPPIEVNEDEEAKGATGLHGAVTRAKAKIWEALKSSKKEPLEKTKLVMLNQTKSVTVDAKTGTKLTDGSITDIRGKMISLWDAKENRQGNAGQGKKALAQCLVMYDIFTNQLGEPPDTLPESTMVTYAGNYREVTGPVYGQYANLFKTFVVEVEESPIDAAASTS